MKKSSAFAHVNRIKRACQRHSHIKNFYPTLNQTKYWFGILNKEIFDSKLKRPRITVSQKKQGQQDCRTQRRMGSKKNTLSQSHHALSNRNASQV